MTPLPLRDKFRDVTSGSFITQNLQKSPSWRYRSESLIFPCDVTDPSHHPNQILCSSLLIPISDFWDSVSLPTISPIAALWAAFVYLTFTSRKRVCTHCGFFPLWMQTQHLWRSLGSWRWDSLWILPFKTSPVASPCHDAIAKCNSFFSRKGGQG